MSATPKNYPSPFQKATCWAALTGLSLLVIILLICALIYGFCRIFTALEPVLLPVVIAGILAYLLSPIVCWVQKRLIQRRSLAVLTVLTVVGLIVAGFVAAIAPKLIDQTGELYDKRQEIVQSSIATAHDLIDNNTLIQEAIDILYEKSGSGAHPQTPSAAPSSGEAELSYQDKIRVIVNSSSSYLTEKLVEWLSAGRKALEGMTFLLVGIVMVPVFLFYFLLESDRISRNWHTILPLRRSHFRNEVVSTLQQINNYIISFVRGQMLVSLIDGVLLGIALKILGLPYAITIGAVAAVVGIIPYIGMISTSIPAMLIAWFTWNDINLVLGVAAIFIGVSQFDGWLIQPRIVGNRVGMHDLTVMFSVLLWSLVLGGAVGALLAVPLTASIKVLFMRYVWPSLDPAARRIKPIDQTESADATAPPQQPAAN